MGNLSAYQIVRSERIYSGKIIKLVKDQFRLRCAPEKLVTRELVQHPGAVAILPLVDSRHIVLLRQFRYAAKGNLWEIPAGTREAGESAIRCARRELEEETGFRARRIKFLTRFYLAPGITNEVMSLFKASDLVKGRKNLDHDEWIEHRVVSLAEACRMVENGLIRDAKTMVGVLWQVCGKK